MCIRNYYRLPLIPFVAIITTIFSVPVIADQTATYQSVRAEKKWGHTRKVMSIKDDAGVPAFLIERDELFLNIQVTRTRWFLYVEVDQPTWDTYKIQSLLKEHPDLAKYLPNPSASNGGVIWIAQHPDTSGGH